MRKHSLRVRVLLIVAAFIVQLGVAVGVTAGTASAVTWPQETVGIHPHQVYTHGDGSITLAECASSFQSYSTKTLRTLSSAGIQTTDIDKSTSSSNWQTVGCEGYGATANDGTFYAKRYKYTWQGYQDIELVAYKNNVMLWSKSVPICTSGQIAGDPRWVTVGNDGDVYAIMAAQCSSPDKLVGFSSKDGTIKFSQPLGADVYNLYSNWPHLAVYPGGVVVLDGQTLRYFNYDGTASGTSTDYIFTLGASESIVNYAIGDGGRFYVAVRSGTTGCSAKTDHVLYHDPNGSSGTISVVAQCVSTSLLKAMPDGGIIVEEQGSYPRMLRYSSTGSLSYDIALWSMSGYGNVWVAWPQVDANGNVVVVRSGVETGSDQDRHVFAYTVGSTGALTSIFDTTAYDTPNTTEVFNYTQGERFGMTSGALYLPICKGTCSSTNPVKLYKISVAGLTLDFPRNEALAAQTHELNYVALGDSFSSGEGVPPFITGTAVTGVNECHRSPQAYPVLLDQDAASGLNLTAFRACSGATTQDLRSGRWGEPGQLDSVTDQTDVVTLSIGGNDVGFSAFAEHCITDGCEEGSIPYQNIVDAINAELDPELKLLYEDILAANNHVKLYVVGYPYQTLDNIPVGYSCQGGSMSADSAAGAYSVVTLLNNAINDAIGVAALDGYGSRIQYVDPNTSGSPFENHTLCNLEPYFNGVSYPIPYTFHPNQMGQASYGLVVKAGITN